MKQKNVKELIILILMLIAIINIVLVINLLFNGISMKTHTSLGFIVIVMQIIAIIISTITLRKDISPNIRKLLMTLLIIIMVATFFIPVQTNLESIESHGGFTPAVMPNKLKQNLYNITIWSS